jgi:hypothetical protein
LARYLVVANQTLGGASLTATVKEHAREGGQIHVVVPATDPAQERGSPSSGSAREIAQQRLDQELERCRVEGIEATGEVGASDPMQAIRDALGDHRYAGLIISTLPAGVSRWLRLDLPHRAVREFRLPVEWVEARSDSDEPTTVHIAVPEAATRAMRGPRFPTTDVPPHT